jgi:hypothetical protein
MLILDDSGAAPALITFVGGPRDTEVQPGDGAEPFIADHGGRYQRSVRCADDGSLRYVWRPTAYDPAEPQEPSR